MDVAWGVLGLVVAFICSMYYKIGDGEVIDTNGSELIPMRVKKVAVLIFIEVFVMMDRSERELM